MANFIDDAREYRARGASRLQLVSYIKLHGVDDDRARRLADKLDMELGLIEQPLPAPPETAAAGVTATVTRPETEPTIIPDGAADGQPVIDLRDGTRLPLVAATDPAIALGRVQHLVDAGVPRRQIQDYLQRSGVRATEAAYAAQTTPQTGAVQVDYATSMRRHKKRKANDGRLLFTTLTALLGAVIIYWGAFVLGDGEPFGLREPWLWVTLTGLGLVISGAAGNINAKL